jgi:hypothetical protein
MSDDADFYLPGYLGQMQKRLDGVADEVLYPNCNPDWNDDTLWMHEQFGLVLQAVWDRAYASGRRSASR